MSEPVLPRRGRGYKVLNCDERRRATLPPVLQNVANLTYTLRGRVDTAAGTRYLLARSDGVNVNVCRSAFVRIENSGKLRGGAL